MTNNIIINIYIGTLTITSKTENLILRKQYNEWQCECRMWVLEDYDSDTREYRTYGYRTRTYAVYAMHVGRRATRHAD